jgi:hypothetical protein
MLIELRAFMLRHHFEYALAVDTALGAVREHTVLPYAGDADLVLGQAAARALLCNKRLIAELRARGLSLFRQTEHAADDTQLGPQRVCLNAQSPLYREYARATGKSLEELRGGVALPTTPSAYVDLHVLWQEGDVVALESHMPCLYKRSDVYPLRAVELHGLAFPVFARHDVYLSSLFGERAWRDNSSAAERKTSHRDWALCKQQLPRYDAFFQRNTPWHAKRDDTCST